MELPEASKRVVAAARELGLELDIHLFPKGTKTSQEAADAVGCELSAIAKTLVFLVDERPVVVFAPGDRRIDEAKLARACGARRARRAGLDECRKATGFAAGGTPAFGFATDVEVLADVQLRRHDEVWSAAGTPTTVYPIPLETLIEVSGARWVDVTG